MRRLIEKHPKLLLSFIPFAFTAANVVINLTAQQITKAKSRVELNEFCTSNANRAICDDFYNPKLGNTTLVETPNIFNPIGYLELTIYPPLVTVLQIPALALLVIGVQNVINKSSSVKEWLKSSAAVLLSLVTFGLGPGVTTSNTIGALLDLMCPDRTQPDNSTYFNCSTSFPNSNRTELEGIGEFISDFTFSSMVPGLIFTAVFTSLVTIATCGSSIASELGLFNRCGKDSREKSNSINMGGDYGTFANDDELLGAQF